MSNESSRPNGALLVRIGEVIRSSGYEAPEQRMVALRRVLHESSIGLTRDEVLLMLANVEARYPDRIYQSAARTSELERRDQALGEEVAQLRMDIDVLRGRVAGLEEIVEGLVRAVWRAAHKGMPGAETPPAPVTNPNSLGPLFDALGLLVEFAVDQETIVREFEDGMDRKPGRPEATVSLQKTLRQLLGGGLSSSEAVERVRRHLGHLGKFPAALISGIQQSWRSGTTSILKFLDPATGKPSMLRAGAVLEEQRTRFKGFWDQLDHNIAHYYRATFERVYSESMEERR